MLSPAQSNMFGEWQTLTTGVSYRTQGNDVIIRIEGTGISASDSWASLGTLPTKYQPLSTIMLSAVGYDTNGVNGYGAGFIRVTEGGDVSSRVASGLNFIFVDARFSIG